MHVHSNRVYIPPARKQLNFISSPNTIQSSPNTSQSPQQPTQPIDNDAYDFVLSPHKITHKHNIRSPVIHKSIVDDNEFSVDTMHTQDSDDAELRGTTSTVKFNPHDSVHEISQQQHDDVNNENIDNSNTQHNDTSYKVTNIMSLVDGVDPDDDSLQQQLHTAQYNSTTHILSPTRKPLTASANKLSGSAAKRIGLSSGSGNNTVKRRLLNDTNVSGTVKVIPVNTKPQPISVITDRSTILLQRGQTEYAKKQKSIQSQPTLQSNYMPYNTQQHTVRPYTSPVKQPTEFNMYQTELIGSPSTKLHHVVSQYRSNSHLPSSNNEEIQRLQKRNIVLTEKLQQKDTEIIKLNLHISELKDSMEATRDDYEFDKTELMEENQRLKEEIAALKDNTVRRTSSRSTVHDTNDEQHNARERDLQQREDALEERLKKLTEFERQLNERQVHMNKQSHKSTVSNKTRQLNRRASAEHAMIVQADANNSLIDSLTQQSIELRSIQSGSDADTPEKPIVKQNKRLKKNRVIDEQ